MAFLPVQWQSVVERSKAMRASLTNGQLVSLVAVFVGVVTDTQWPAFCVAFGLDDLAALDQHGLAANTLVIFTADNGTSPNIVPGSAA